MNTVQLAQLAASVTRIHDVSEASLADANTLASLMSRAIQRFFTLAPSNWRRTTVSEHLLPPESLTFTVWEGGNTVSGSPFLPRHRGCTILIDGDSTPNEVTSSNTLLDDYKGTSGEKHAILYNDCLPLLDFRVERVCSRPVRVSGDGQILPLAVLDGSGKTVSDPQLEALASSTGYATAYSNDWPFQRKRTSDYPTHCWIEHVGGSQQVAEDAAFQIRLWPLAVNDFSVQFDAEIRPFSITIADLTTPARVPVDVSLAHSTLVPLVQGMAARSIIRDPKLESDQIAELKEARMEAEETIRGLTPVFGPATGTMSTPTGW